MILFLLHKNFKKSEKPLISGENVFLVKSNSVYLKKRTDGGKLKHSIYLRDIFTFYLEKEGTPGLCCSLGWNFLNPTFSKDKECSLPALTANHAFYTTVCGVLGMHVLLKARWPGRGRGHHTPGHCSCSSLQLWYALCLQEQFAPTTPHFWGKGHWLDVVATGLVHVLLNSRF